MAIEKLTKDMDIIANLDDEPIDVGGLTAAELKAKFDEGGKALKAYLNETLIPTLETLGVEQAVLAPEGAGFKYLRLNSNLVLEFSDDGETWRTAGSQIVDGDGNVLGYGAYVSAEDRERWNGKQSAIPGKAGQVPVFSEGGWAGADQIREETAALYGLGAEAVPDDVLELLSKAPLLKTVGHDPIYREITVDISALSVGDTALIPVGDAVVEYWVAAKDYEPELNGTGRTLLVAKSGIASDGYKSSTDSTYYPGSKPDVYLEETYKPQIRADVRKAIGNTTIKVKKYSSDEIFNISREVFILSATEYGYQSLGDGVALSIASEVRPSNACWTRTPKSISTVFYCSKSGNGDNNYTNRESIAPAFTLPNDFAYTIYADEGGNYLPEQAYTPIRQALTDVLGNGAGTPKIETGFYFGTGTHGTDNPNVLTFDSNVLLLAVYKADHGLHPVSGGFLEGLIWLPSVEETNVYFGSSTTDIHFSQDGHSVAWHNTLSATASSGPGYQLNVSGQKYFYFALTQ